MRFLIVEDELKMASLVRRGLAEEGHAADVATSGEDALWMAEAHPYDAIVLDVMLPGRDGFETCRELRKAGVWAPVLMLTARDSVGDRVNGLDAGADDYLTKPFSFAELLARLRALIRRGGVERPTELVVGDLRLDPAARRVWRGDTEIPLSPKEFALLETFMRRPGPGAEPAAADRARLGLRLREPLERDRRLRPLPPREGRPAVRRGVARDRARSRLPAEGRMSRIPIRIRLTLFFAAAMAIVLAAIGALRLLARGLGSRPRHRQGPALAGTGSVRARPARRLGAHDRTRADTFAELVSRTGASRRTPLMADAPVAGPARARRERREVLRPFTGPGAGRARPHARASAPERRARRRRDARAPQRHADEPPSGVPRGRPDRSPADVARRVPARGRRATADRVHAPARRRDLHPRRSTSGCPSRRRTTRSRGSAGR